MTNLYDYTNIIGNDIEEEIKNAISYAKEELYGLTTERTCMIYSSKVSEYLKSRHISSLLVNTLRDYDLSYEHQFVAVPKSEKEKYIIDLTFDQFGSDSPDLDNLKNTGYQVVEDKELKEYLDIISSVYNSKNKELDRFVNFLDTDKKIKEIIMDMSMNDVDTYSDDALVNYEDRLHDDLIDLDYRFEKIFNYLNIDNTEFKNFLRDIKLRFINASGRREELKEVYKEYVSDMREEFVDSVNRTCVGYYFGGSPKVKPKTLNEYLHFLHSYAVNDDGLFNKINIVDSKDDFYLRGKPNEDAKKVFEEVSKSNIDSDKLDILGTDDRTLIMIRDYGHATLMEITKDGDKRQVSYFIPKVCNLEMVKELKGISKISDDGRWATGMYETNKEDVGKITTQVISKIPTDFDMPEISYTNFYK